MNLVDRAFIRAYSKQKSNDDISRSALPDGSPVAQELVATAKAKCTASRGETLSRLEFSADHGVQRVPVPQSSFMSLSGQAPVEIKQKLSFSGLSRTPAAQTVKARVDNAHGRAAVTENELGNVTNDPIPAPHFLAETSSSVPSDNVVFPPEVASGQPLEGQPIFPATWEVDHYRWPLVCRQLLDSQTDYFSRAVKRLAEVAERGDRSFAVMSPESGDGCTTITLCLARQLAAAHLSVALIDADTERPELARQLEVQVASGWNDVHVDRADLTEVAITSLDDKITLVPLREAIPMAERANLRPTVIQLMNELASHHDLVLVDAGRLGSDSLGLLSAKHIGGLRVLFVQNVRPNPESYAKSTSELERLRMSQIPIVGIAENFAA